MRQTEKLNKTTSGQWDCMTFKLRGLSLLVCYKWLFTDRSVSIRRSAVLGRNEFISAVQDRKETSTQVQNSHRQYSSWKGHSKCTHVQVHCKINNSNTSPLRYICFLYNVFRCLKGRNKACAPKRRIENRFCYLHLQCCLRSCFSVLLRYKHRRVTRSENETF